MAASNVFGVSPDSLIPPSTQPTQLHGEPYTKEFFDYWWKKVPELIKSIIQKQKIATVRDLELILTAATRIPGMSVAGVAASFQIWMLETMQNFQLLPHYETEWKERIKKARKKPNKTQADWELVKSFIENKSKFIQEAFEGDISPTLLSHVLSEIKMEVMKADLDLFKQPKAERLKLMANLGTKFAKKGFENPPAFLYVPKLKR